MVQNELTSKYEIKVAYSLFGPLFQMATRKEKYGGAVLQSCGHGFNSQPSNNSVYLLLVQKNIELRAEVNKDIIGSTDHIG